MMKNLKKGVALLLAFVLIFTLTACSSRLKGTYVSDEGGISQSLTFNDDNVTMSAFGMNITGKYKISNGQITITYSVLGMEDSMTESYSKSVNTITVGGTKFVKS